MTIRTLASQWTSLVFSVFLALFVWVVAANEANPTRVAQFQDPIPIELQNREDGLLLFQQSAQSVKIRVRAPEASWQNLRATDFQAIADLKGMGTGLQQVPVVVKSADPQVEIDAIDPPAITVRLEAVKQVKKDIRVRVLDDPPVGYQYSAPSVTPTSVTVTGPQTIIEQINDVTAEIAIRGAKSSIDQEISIVAHDAQGNPLQNITIDPSVVSVHLTIVQRVGYKDVAVRAVTKGAVASGYWVSDISVDPPTVTLIGSPDALDKIPGFVEALPVIVNGAQASITKHVGLNLPVGVSALSVTDLLVKVAVEPVLGGITIRRSVTFSQAGCELHITLSPDTVEVIISGPLPILQALTQDDVQVLVDVTSCTPGTYQIAPRVANYPSSAKVESIVPNSVQVNITQK